jgi:hypothetical protein
MGNFRLPKLIFANGMNAKKPRIEDGTESLEYLSLQELALTSERREADPTFREFVWYYNDQNYAYNTIQAALGNDIGYGSRYGTTKWKTPQQRVETIVLTSAFQVVQVYAISRLHTAHSECLAATSNPNRETMPSRYALDQVAALLIGSMEGRKIGGSEDHVQDGQLLWGLGNRLAFQFQTMNKEGYAIVNEQIMYLLLAANAQFDALDCRNLKKTTDEIERLMTVAIMQGVIRAAIDTSSMQSPDAAASSKSMAQGEALARSILPLLEDAAPLEADAIQINMLRATDDELRGVVSEAAATTKVISKPVKDGPQMVASALGSALTKGTGLSCQYLGKSQNVQPCIETGFKTASSTTTITSSGSTRSRTSSALAIIGITCWVVFGTVLIL